MTWWNSACQSDGALKQFLDGFFKINSLLLFDATGVILQEILARGVSNFSVNFTSVEGANHFSAVDFIIELITTPHAVQESFEFDLSQLNKIMGSSYYNKIDTLKNLIQHRSNLHQNGDPILDFHFLKHSLVFFGFWLSN